METYEFTGTIEAARGGGAWIPVPFDTREAFGTGRSVRVRAVYDGHTAQSSISRMGGRSVLGIHKATRAAIEKDVGDTVHVRLSRDESPRVVEIPPELAATLAGAPAERTAFDALSYTRRKELARWVGTAKKAETRERRAARALELIREGRSP